MAGCSSGNSSGTKAGASATSGGTGTGTSGNVGVSTGGASGGTTGGEPGGATSSAVDAGIGGADLGGTSAGVSGAASSGAAGVGGATTGGTSGAVGGATSAGSSGASAAGSTSGGSGGSPTSPDGVDAWYEAEAVPPNVLKNGASKVTCNTGGQYNEATCTHDQLTEGMTCCSGGGLVASLLGRSNNNVGSGVEFHDVVVPSDGLYAVTWWYHCGSSDVYGDTNCGGLHYSVPAGIGCRPHIIDVNGVTVTSTALSSAQFFQFPCYSTPWSAIHAANTTLPLKAGANTIYIHPPHVANLDSADIDVIHVTAVGRGTGSTVTPVVGNGAD